MFRDATWGIIKHSEIPVTAMGIYDHQDHALVSLIASSTPELLNVFLDIQVECRDKDKPSLLSALAFPLVPLDLYIFEILIIDEKPFKMPG